MGRRISYELEIKNDEERRRFYQEIFDSLDKYGIMTADFGESARFLFMNERLYQIGIATNLKGVVGIVLTLETAGDGMPSRFGRIVGKYQFKKSEKIYNL